MIDRFISILSIAQAIFTTLQVGSSLLEGYLLDDSNNQVQDSLIDGPRILPPNITNNDSSTLYELTVCFRQGIKVGVLDNCENNENETIVYRIEKTSQSTDVDSDDPDPSSTSYSLSPQPVLSRQLIAQFEARNETRLKELDDDTKELTEYPNEVACYESHKITDDGPEKIDETGFHNATDRTRNILGAFRFFPLPWLLPARQAASPSEDDWDDDDEDLDFQDAYVTDLSLTNSTATIRTFAPRAFSSLRRYFGISSSEFQRVLLSSGPYVSFQANSKGSAARGVFFFTPNGAFLIKTIKKSEKASLLSILPQYTEYMRRQKGRSLLSHICGMYEVIMPGPSGTDQEYCLIIMNSVFPAGLSLSERFDLKGSTVGRKAGSGESVMKDLDLMERKPLHLGSLAAKKSLMAQLKKDVALLEQCSLIDYSLLVGVSLADDESTESTPPPICKRLLHSLLTVMQTICRSPHRIKPNHHTSSLSAVKGLRRNQPATYFLGVIDFLQPFNYKKMVEYQLKSLIHQKDTFSCVPPPVYSKRFLTFLNGHIS